MLLCSPLLHPIIYAARLKSIRKVAVFRYGAIFPCLKPYLSELQKEIRKQSFVTNSLRGQFELFNMHQTTTQNLLHCESQRKCSMAKIDIEKLSESGLYQNAQDEKEEQHLAEEEPQQKQKQTTGEIQSKILKGRSKSYSDIGDDILHIPKLATISFMKDCLE